MTVIYLTSAWLAGIWLSRVLSPPSWLLLALCLAPVAVAAWRRKDPLPRLLALCALSALLGGLRYSHAQPILDEAHVAFYNGRGGVILRGVVANLPDVRDRHVNLRLAAESLLIGESWIPVRGEVLLKVPSYPIYAYGDRLQATGKLETPPQNPGFSYRDYLARKGIHAIMYYPQIALLESDQGNPLWAKLRHLQLQGERTISHILPQPQAGLLSGILLGIESGIPRSLMDQFNATGTSHIIVISGFNISVIAGLLCRWGRRMVGNLRAAALAIAGVALYTLLVGADPAVVRAAIMGGLSLLALLAGRQAWALNSLAIAAFLMTAHHPMVLWDMGFQLSFAATLSLTLFVPPLSRWLEGLLSSRLTEKDIPAVLRFLDETLVVTLAAQALTLPIILHNFGRLSLITPLSNFLILPAQPGLMLSGALATALGLIWIPLGRVAGWVAWAFATYTIRVVELTSRFPFASLQVDHPTFPWLFAYYGATGFGIWVIRQEPEARRAIWEGLKAHLPLKAIIIGLALAAILAWSAALSLPDGKLHVSFLDVGQGDAILIVTPGGRQVLVDGGPSPNALAAALGKRMPFWDRSLDVVILTHPDEDHAAGLVPILERYDVDLVLDTDLPHNTASSRRWAELLEERNLAVRVAQRGMRLEMGKALRIEVLHPSEKPKAADTNNNSIVLRILYGQTAILLTGDLENEGEQVLLGSGQPLAAQVLKVSHHGTGKATSKGFLESVRPIHAVISVGEGNRFGHPSPETLERLQEAKVQVWRTDLHGTIEVVADGRSLWIGAGK